MPFAGMHLLYNDGDAPFAHGRAREGDFGGGKLRLLKRPSDAR